MMRGRLIRGGIGIAIAVVSLTIEQSARAQSGDAILDLLVKKGLINQREANDVREQADAQNKETVEQYNKLKMSSWLDSITFSGDFRLRSEYFNFETNPATGQPLSSDRTRWRYRLRFGAEMKLPEWATVNTRLTSDEGSPGVPISGNQTFNNTFTKKPIDIDVASVTLQPPGQDWVKVVAGKMDNLLYQSRLISPMVWDYDVTPEGIEELVQWRFGDKQQFRVFANAGQFAAKEFSNDNNDVYLFDQQAGIEANLGADPKHPKVKVTGVGGYFVTDNIKNYKPGDSPNIGNALVGTNGGTNEYANFQVAYARADVAWRVMDEPFLGTPALLTFSGEYDVNLSSAFKQLLGVPSSVTSNATNQTHGWTAGVTFGEAKKKGQWQTAYQYKYLQADAVFDAITDDDFGLGGTDRKGSIVKAIYLPQDWWVLTFTTFITEKISGRPNVGHNMQGYAGSDELRVQMDTMFKF